MRLLTELTQDAQIRSLATLTGTQGQMPDDATEKDVLLLGMIAEALGRKMTWAQIGSALKWGNGKQAKRTAHALRRQTEAKLRQQAVAEEMGRWAAVGGDD